MQESLCKTCSNILNFPECCEENLKGSLKATIVCRNYRECRVVRDCLSCSSSYSDGCDILHCIKKDGRVVKENGYCEEWN